MNINDLNNEINIFFTTNGKDVWKLVSYFKEPSCVLRNMETEKRQEFGISSQTAQGFHRIKMPEIEETP